MWDSEEGLVPCLQELMVSRVAGNDQGLRLETGTLCSSCTQELGQAWTKWPVAEGGTPAQGPIKDQEGQGQSTVGPSCVT